jgi:hypothetical protein
MSVTSFVPRDEIKKLAYGSYEQLTLQVESAIEQAKEKLFGTASPIELLATFSGYALVLSEDARVFRVRYEKAQNGDVLPIQVEDVDVPAYKADTLPRFVKREAGAYVDAFLSGARSSAKEHLSTLTAFVHPEPAPLAPAKVTETFEHLVKGERGWKKVYSERIGQIHETVKDVMPGLNERRTTEKFLRLRDGSIPSAELPKYESLVRSDLKYIAGRVDSALSLTEDSMKLLKGAVPALKDEKDPTIKMFQSFSEDYLEDLRGVRKALTEAENHISAVSDFATIYDTLAAQLFSYEVAGQFVSAMARRLSEVSK